MNTISTDGRWATGRGDDLMISFASFKERIIFLTGEVNDTSASLIGATVVWAKMPPKTSVFISIARRIHFCRFCHYGCYIKCDISTNCIGLAASMGLFCSVQAPGKRYALLSEVWSQPSAARRSHRCANLWTDCCVCAKLNELLAKQQVKYWRISRDTERDNFMSAASIGVRFDW